MTVTQIDPRARTIAGTRLAMPLFTTLEPAADQTTTDEGSGPSLSDRLVLAARIRKFVTHRRRAAVAA